MMNRLHHTLLRFGMQTSLLSNC